MITQIKKYGVTILLCILSMPAIAGCATQYNVATRQEELILVPVGKEIAMGRSMAQSVEEKLFKVDPNPHTQERIDRVGAKIAAVCDRKELDYHFKVLDKDEEKNAFSLPGGYVFIFNGLLSLTKSDDELAAVLAHEIAHVCAKHSVKRYQTAYGYNIFLLLTSGIQSNASDRNSAYTAVGTLVAAYSREDELMADTLAIKYMRKAGYDPDAYVSFLKNLQDFDFKQPIRVKGYFRSQPYLSDRVANSKAVVSKKVDFEDFINKTDQRNLLY